MTLFICECVYVCVYTYMRVCVCTYLYFYSCVRWYKSNCFLDYCIRGCVCACFVQSQTFSKITYLYSCVCVRLYKAKICFRLLPPLKTLLYQTLDDKWGCTRHNPVSHPDRPVVIPKQLDLKILYFWIFDRQ